MKSDMNEKYALTDATWRSSGYPGYVTNALSAMKVLCGCIMVVLGSLALFYKASYSKTAVGLWAGILVIISGVLGLFSVRTKASRPYVLSFFTSCGVSLIVSVLVLIYSASGLAKDSGFPGGFVRDETTGELVPVSQINLPTRQPAMIVNMLLILVAALDVLLCLPSLIICLRQLCLCFPQPYSITSASTEWLIDDQQPQPPCPPPHMEWNPIYYSPTSGLPAHQMLVFPSSEASQISLDPRLSGSRRMSMRSYAMTSPGLEMYAAPSPFYMVPPSHHSPASNMSQPLLPAFAAAHHHPWLYAAGDSTFSVFHPGDRPKSRHRSQPQRRTHTQSSNKTSSTRTNNVKEHKRHRGGSKANITDSDLDKTYTGLDRELAEEFINQTMDPTQHAAQQHPRFHRLSASESGGAW